MNGMKSCKTIYDFYKKAGQVVQRGYAGQSHVTRGCRPVRNIEKCLAVGFSHKTISLLFICYLKAKVPEWKLEWTQLVHCFYLLPMAVDMLPSQKSPMQSHCCSLNFDILNTSITILFYIKVSPPPCQ